MIGKSSIRKHLQEYKKKKERKPAEFYYNTMIIRDSYIVHGSRFNRIVKSFNKLMKDKGEFLMHGEVKVITKIQTNIVQYYGTTS